MNGHWVDTIQIKAGLFVLQTTHTVIIVFYIHLPIPQTGCRTFQKFQRLLIQRRETTLQNPQKTETSPFRFN
jgi:hypothetical protein